MKKILLASVALTAFAGAAAAEVTLSGDAKLGWNDDHEGGVYAVANVDITASQTLDNGITAGFVYGMELEQLENGALQAGDFDNNLKLTIGNDMFTLSGGQAENAAFGTWSGVADMAQDGFSEHDAEEVLRLDLNFGQVSTAVSGIINPISQDLVQMSYGVAADLGAVSVVASYQEAGPAAVGSNTATDATAANVGYIDDDAEDYNADEIFAVSAAFAAGGADFVVAYADNRTDNEDSTGMSVSYAMGDYTLGAHYVSESANADDTFGVSVAYAAGALAADGSWTSVNDVVEYSLGASYQVDDAIVVGVALLDGDDATADDHGTAVYMTYDLGAGAALKASYADAANAAGAAVDDVAGYRAGSTIELSFAF
ncbi:porin [Marivivens sp. JLT3646]|uniref:porin n=1 Tax=Marivivens sp. JLT3646 TaxID=1920883 RepID=UPI0007FD7585|nr:porin [Marivivens sp. JLT3646]APO87894.1 hypothetical protein BSK21_13215 [Marivivens sp. JLT3646]OBR38625.1 hypothetical protein A9199_13510 [Donghicola sp. JL3646]